MNEYITFIFELLILILIIIFGYIITEKICPDDDQFRPRNYKDFSRFFVKSWCNIAITKYKIQDLHHYLRKYVRSQDITVRIDNDEVRQKLTITFTLNGEIPLTITRYYRDWFECGNLHNLVNDILTELEDKIVDAYILK